VRIVDGDDQRGDDDRESLKDSRDKLCHTFFSVLVLVLAFTRVQNGEDGEKQINGDTGIQAKQVHGHSSLVQEI